MAWTAPMTAVAGNAFTAAQFNTHVRDNLLETAPAKATTANGYFVATGANAIAQRLPGGAIIDTTETRSSTTYGDLTTIGPSVTVTTGTKALVMITAQMENDTNGGFALATFTVSGATSVAAGDGSSIAFEQPSGTNGQAATCTRTRLIDLTPGSNTFTMKYRALVAGTASFSRRSLIVIPF